MNKDMKLDRNNLILGIVFIVCTSLLILAFGGKPDLVDTFISNNLKAYYCVCK